MHAGYSAVVAITLAVMVGGCAHDAASTSPTTTSPTPASGTAAAKAGPAAATSGTSTTSSVSDPGGEWNFVPPAGVPNGGCISLSDISGTGLSWTIQAVAGHPHTIWLQGIVKREENPGCMTLDPSDSENARALQLTGGDWKLGPTDPGTRTLTWLTDECKEDGGRFQIDVMVRRDPTPNPVPDRETFEVVVNCGTYVKP